MGGVFSRIITPTYKKIIILGPNSVGKTSIFTVLTSYNTIKKTESWVNFFSLTKREAKPDRLLEMEDQDSDKEQTDILDRRPFKPVPSTISFNHEKLNFQDKLFSLWELSNVIKDHWKCYYHSMEGVIIVLDAYELKYQQYEESLTFLRNVHKELLKHNEQPSSSKIRTPTLIFLNKIDKSHQRKLKADLPEQLLLDKYFANYKIQECSVIERYTVLEGFNWLVSKIYPNT
ncbi:small GTP-binding protein domain [Pseudoloma neurophilia]|uniref:Small GTP-binding protein domain n=1 Tax=Pseudoloma neurophilia TaxID=146866 RepID=A0A0R0M1G0_9MICR|nr:small GTP-binding protein domain [Pseudoloma neurophilia]